MVHMEAWYDGNKTFLDTSHENSERLSPFCLECPFGQSDRALQQSGGKRVRSTNRIGRYKNATGSMCYDQWEIRHKQVATVGGNIYGPKANDSPIVFGESQWESLSFGITWTYYVNKWLSRRKYVAEDLVGAVVTNNA